MRTAAKMSPVPGGPQAPFPPPPPGVCWPGWGSWGRKRCKPPGMGGEDGGRDGTDLHPHDGDHREEHREGAAAKAGEIVDRGDPPSCYPMHFLP